jgi:IMP dehydrogenase
MGLKRFIFYEFSWWLFFEKQSKQKRRIVMKESHYISTDGNGLACEEIFRRGAGVTFDDLILLPSYSDVSGGDVSLESILVPGLTLHLPLVSSPMDTVTEWKTAICMALHGGLGIIHFNLTGEEAAAQVRRVKRFRTGFIFSPECRSPSDPCSEVARLKEQQGFSTILVTEDGTQSSKLVGMVMKGNVALEPNKSKPLQEVMIPLDELEVRQANEVGDLSAARGILRRCRSVSKLPLLNPDGSVYALVTREDVAKSEAYPHALLDKNEQLRVGAAVSTHERDRDRVEALLDVGVDVLVIDSAQGSTQFAVDLIRHIRSLNEEIPIIAGNVVTPAQAEPLIEVGANILRVGMGSGSICTTQDQVGVGRAQLSAVYHTSLMAHQRNVFVVADGGIRTTADMTKALACGARAVMLGRFIAGCDESPAVEEEDPYGRRFKRYRGMGSAGAIREGGMRRYGEEMGSGPIVAQGIEGLVPAQGSLDRVLPVTAAAIRKGFEYCGCNSINMMHERARAGEIRFELQSPAARAEGHAHDVLPGLQI